VIVARPALGRRGLLAGVAREAAYVEAGGFVVVLTAERPVLPNGAQVARLPAAGEDVVVHADDVWDPRLRIGDPSPHDAPVPDALARAVETRDPELAAAAGAGLIGRGPGLTPEGDDLIAGAAAVVAIGSWPEKDEWLEALLGGDLRRRTTALSATLLELAAQGMGPEPLQGWLAGDAGALDRLTAIGHSTGRAIAAGAALALANV
jgi:Protein of unknown function (DUF2877)